MRLGLATTFVCPGSSTAQELIVEADVAPYISVSSYASKVYIGSVSRGDFSGTFSFAIEANQEGVSFQVLATDLYKDSNPAATEIKPITLNRSAGVDVHAPVARVITPPNWNAAFVSSANLNKPEGIFEGYKTDQIKLISKQQGIFDQDVDLRVTWTQDDSIKPAGRYGGYIVLYVSLIE